MTDSPHNATLRRSTLLIVVLAAAIGAFLGCDANLLQNIKDDVEKANYVGTPNLVVSQGATVIASGGSYDLFQNVPTNAVDSLREFVIRNDGDGDLILSGGVAASLSGDSEFTVGIVAPMRYGPKGDPDDHGSFTLVFNPTAQTSYSTTLTIQSNDPDQPLLTFTVTGNGSAPDFAQPQVESTDPSWGQSGVRIDADITVTFSEAMQASVAGVSIFKLYPTAASPDEAVAGTYSQQADGEQVVLNPTASLQPGTQYTGRIDKDAADLAGLKLLGGTYTWTFTTLPLPGAPVLSSPADGAIDQPLAPTLDWDDASGGESYEVFCNTTGTFGTTPNATLTGSPPPSQFALSSLSRSTTYYWKVVAVNSSGKTPCAKTFSFTTIPNAPGAPTLTSPANGATGLGTTVTLSWNAVTGAASYKLYCDTSNPPTTLKTTTDQLSYPMATAYENRYYWKVEAVNAGGSAESGVRYFDTLYKPGAPSLGSPANGATGQSTSVSLSWSAGSGGTPAKYHVYCDTNNPPTTLKTGTGTTSTSYAMSTSYSTHYYWRVVAENAAGVGPTSGTRDFYTLYPPALSTPADDATGVLSPVTVSWAAATGATSYKVYCDTNTTPTTLKASPTTTTASFAVSYSTRYYWRVESVNSSTGATVTSDTRDFYTLYPPSSAPTLNSPADGAQGLGTQVNLMWSSVSGATAYVVHCDTANPPTTPRTDTTYNFTDYKMSTSYSTQYYWKVAAWNAAGYGPPSAVRSFATLYPPSSAPTLNAPAAGVDEQSPFVRFGWSTVARATSYDLYCSTAATPALYQSGIAALSFYPSSPLAYYTKYYWQVVGKNAAGSGPASSTYSFITRKEVRWPKDGATDVPRSVIEADWLAYGGANGYCLWLKQLPSGTWNCVAEGPNHYYFNPAPTVLLPAKTEFEWYYEAYNGKTKIFTSPHFKFETGS